MSTKPRGFAAMSAEKRKAISSKGGKGVRPENRSFSKDRDLAKAAGSKGGSTAPLSKPAAWRNAQ